MRRTLIGSVGMARLAGLALLLGLLALRVLDPGPVQQLRLGAFDLYQQIKPREAAGPVPVTILDIDDPSLEALGQWPWPRTRIAEMIARAFEAGAVAMAFDIVFAEPDRLSPPTVARDNPDLPDAAREALAALPDTDAALAEMIGRARIVTGQASVRTARHDLAVASPVRPTPHAILGPDARPFLQQFPDLVQNLPALEDAAAGHGVFSVRPDRDGIYRRVPVVMMVDGTLRLGLGPELLRVATGGNAFALRGNAAGADGVVLGGQLVRTAADGTVWPWLTPSDPARYVSVRDLLSGDMPQGRLRGQLVLVGTSAIGLEDFRPTALGVPMAGVEVHAQMLENILTDTLLQRPNYALAAELAAAALLGLIVIALVPMGGVVFVFALTLVMVGGYGGAAWAAFDMERILLDPTWPILTILLLVMLMSSANYLREERQRRQIRGAFGQYVSPDLVEKLSNEPEALTLGGERRELTILFSDVRGFTPLAEGFRDDPAGLTALMNSFLTVLSRAILDEGGTIDKFMGDAVMAFWNAPLDTPDHEAAACRAALAMRASIDRLNKKRAEEAAARGETALPINVGVGLNAGTCTVGNMGSDMRFDYTALGDAVNLASRLEGQSANYGVGIIAGASVAEKVADDFAMLELDLLRVKGKQEPERIFGLFGDREMAASTGFATLREANATMRTAYAAQDWDAAEAAMAPLVAAGDALGLDLSGYADAYRARIAGLRAEPPGADWDGVHVATTK